MNRFVVRVTLRQHVPLGTRIEDPQDGFENLAGRDGPASRATGWNVLLRKVLPDTLPMLVA